jgi:hypothetical protein
MFKKFFLRRKVDYFRAILSQAYNRSGIVLKDERLTLNELFILTFPEKEILLNVEQALKLKTPIPYAAMSYYTFTFYNMYNDGLLDDENFTAVLTGQIEYLVACKHFTILEAIQKNIVPESDWETWNDMVAEENSIQPD